MLFPKIIPRSFVLVCMFYVNGASSFVPYVRAPVSMCVHAHQ